MALFIIRKLLLFAVVIVGVSVITFFLSTVVPGDPVRLALGQFATHEQVEEYRRELGLDQPVYKQYAHYAGRLLQGDLGVSIHTGFPVKSDISKFFAATFELTTISMIVALLIGLPLGVLSAVYRDSLLDHAARIISLSGVSMPVFWLGLLLQLIFAVWLGVAPIGGRVSSQVSAAHPLKSITGLFLIDSILTGNWPFLLDFLKHLALPAATLAYSSLVIITRMTRANMLEVLRQDYVRTADVYGLPRHKVIGKYALKNALISTVTIVGLAYGMALSGTFLVETIFSWPGLGRYAASSIINSDYPAVMGTTLLVALIYTVLNLLVDLVYTILDPRISYR